VAVTRKDFYFLFFIFNLKPLLCLPENKNTFILVVLGKRKKINNDLRWLARAI
jgi:hypothetical protein